MSKKHNIVLAAADRLWLRFWLDLVWNQF